ncbi:MAG: hypothetical protein ACRC0G_07300 [Fusobacteriaceae bacterium]
MIKLHFDRGDLSPMYRYMRSLEIAKMAFKIKYGREYSKGVDACTDAKINKLIENIFKLKGE